MEVKSVRLRFGHHARHNNEQGSWFHSESPRQGKDIFIYDRAVQNITGMVSVTPARITAINEGSYVLPVCEVAKAERARHDWLKKNFVTTANRIHREARARPDDDFRYDSLHPRNGEWIVRFTQKSTGEELDASLSEVQAMIKGLLKVEEMRALFLGQPDEPKIKIPERDLLKAMCQLKAIGPRIRTEQPTFGNVQSA